MQTTARFPQETKFTIRMEYKSEVKPDDVMMCKEALAKVLKGGK